jgi:hypothetical protein
MRRARKTTAAAACSAQLLGGYGKHAPGHCHRGKRRPLLRFSVHLRRRLADSQGVTLPGPFATLDWFRVDDVNGVALVMRSMLGGTEKLDRFG